MAGSQVYVAVRSKPFQTDFGTPYIITMYHVSGNLWEPPDNAGVQSLGIRLVCRVPWDEECFNEWVVYVIVLTINKFGEK